MIFPAIVLRPLFGIGAHVTDAEFGGFRVGQTVTVKSRTEYVGATEHRQGVPLHMPGGRGVIEKLFVDARGVPSVYYVGICGYAAAPISALRA